MNKPPLMGEWKPANGYNWQRDKLYYCAFAVSAIESSSDVKYDVMLLRYELVEKVGEFYLFAIDRQYEVSSVLFVAEAVPAMPEIFEGIWEDRSGHRWTVHGIKDASSCGARFAGDIDLQWEGTRRRVTRMWDRYGNWDITCNSPHDLVKYVGPVVVK